MTLIDLIDDGKPLGDDEEVDKSFYGFDAWRKVSWDWELDRIMKLPRRPTLDAPDMSHVYRKPMRRAVLWPFQSACLWNLYQAGALVAMGGVGAGKCVRGGTEFFDVATGMRRTASETLDNLVVPTLKDRALGLARASSFPSGQKQCILIEIEDGSKLEVSTDHPVLTVRGWIPAGELKTVDLVAVATKMPDPDVFTRVSDDEVRLLALIEADGGCSNDMVSFTKSNPIIVDEFLRLAQSVCGGFSEKKSKSKAREFTLLKSRSFRDRWNLYGLSKNKRLHPSLWGLPGRQVAIFVNHFWACDGWVDKHYFGLTLASEKLIDDVRFMLLRLGVRSRKRFSPKKLKGVVHDAWSLAVYGDSALAFYRTVGPLLGKENQSTSLYNKLASLKRNPNSDIVPIGREELKRISDELGGNLRKILRNRLGATNDQYISRSSFEQFCRDYRYTGWYTRYLIDGVAWERVKRMTLTEKVDVFDLSVPETGNFVADGVIIHNTLVGLLAPTVLDARRTVYFTTAQLRNQVTNVDHPIWAREFHIRPIGDPRNPEDGRIYVVGYEAFSHEGMATVLDHIHPDLVVGDEAHKLKNLGAARTKRFLRFMLEVNPGCRFVPMTGSFTSSSPRNFAHLFELALRKLSPIPSIFRAWNSCNEWCEALEVPKMRVKPRQPGALVYLATPDETVAMARLDTSTQTAARSAFRRRMVETPGVVATSESAIGTSLILTALRFAVPPEVQAAIATLEKEWRVGDDEIEEAKRFWAVARQLSLGFYYVWEWPDGVKDEEWLLARSAWHKEVREMLTGRGRLGLDSPGLLAKAAERGQWHSEAWPWWKKVKDRPPPKTMPRWISDFAVKQCAVWHADPDHRPGLIWCEQVEFGCAVAETLRLPRAGAGGAPVIADALLKKQSCVVSIHSIREGKNLQSVYARNLITCPPQAGDVIEQVLGRTHRPGQRADEVTAEFFAHTRAFEEALKQLLVSADYLETLTGQKQKIRFATRIGW